MSKHTCWNVLLLSIFICSRFENVFLPPSVCMLQVSRVLRPGPCLTQTNRAGATMGTTSSPSCLCLLAAVFTLWGAVQPFIFLLGSTLPSRVGTEVSWRCFPPQKKNSPGETIHSAFSKLTSYKSVKAMLFVHNYFRKERMDLK